MKVCMIVPDSYVKGGIAAVVNGYTEYDFGDCYEIKYIESYCDGSKWKKLIKAIWGYILFIKEITGDKPDIVHVHSSFGPSFYRKMPFIYLARWKNIPVINHIHGADFDVFYRKASSRKKKLIGRLYNQCQMLIALSNEWKANLELIVPPEKIFVLENYCKIPDLKGNIKKKQILFLGEIGARKGCFDIPDILEKTFEKADETPTIMAGDGAVTEVKKMLCEKGLSGVVSFPGWVRGEEKERLLKESSIFLFPSYNEGMPMAVLEAMAYEMAIVTTNVGGIPKLIKEGVNGYICEPGNAVELADKLADLLQDEIKQRAFGCAARREAIERYSIESHMKKLFDLYKQVYAERGADGN